MMYRTIKNEGNGSENWIALQPTQKQDAGIGTKKKAPHFKV